MYGFRVLSEDYDYNEDGERVDVDPPLWRVELPHQCDAWSITTDYGAESWEKAVAALQEFIAEAQAALADLKAKRERDPRWVDGEWVLG